MMKKSVLISAVFSVLFGLAGPALASTLGISPIMVELSAKSPYSSVTISNGGGSAITVQAELFRWTQVDGKSLREPSRTVIINPPIFTIEPGEKQLVRIGIFPRHMTGNEQAFRLVFTELAETLNAKSVSPKIEVVNGFRMLLSHDIPLYVQSSKAKVSGPKVDFVAAIAETGIPRLTISNTGDTRYRIVGVSVAAQDKITNLPFIVALAGSSISVDFPDLPASATSLTIKSKSSEGEPLEIEVPVTGPR